MANKEKEIIPNNLLKIREELNYTQKDFGDILGVSERMVCNYETSNSNSDSAPKSNLPIDKAVFISKKWNYSLDWIYAQSDSPNLLSAYNKERPNFMVDIRQFLKMSDDKIIFSIPYAFWEYMYSVNNVYQSNMSENERKRKIAELNGKYTSDNKTNIFKECSFCKDVFIQRMCFGEHCVPYGCKVHIGRREPSDKEKEEVTKFLESLNLEEN